MRYTEYTKTRAVFFPVFFRCEKCGKDNIEEHPFLIHAKYDDLGTFTKRGLKKREKEADDELDKRQSGLFDEVFYRTKKRDFKNVEYHCCCSNCYAVPKWSSFRNNILDIICGVLWLIAFLFLLISFFAIGDGLLSLVYFFISIGIGFVAFIPYHIFYSSKMSKIWEMDQQYMPIVFQNDEHLLSVIEGLKAKESTSKNVIE